MESKDIELEEIIIEISQPNKSKKNEEQIKIEQKKDMLSQLKNTYIESENIKKKIKKNEVSIEELDQLNIELKIVGDSFDNILESLLSDDMYLNDKGLLFEAMKNQAMISKTAHKLHRETNKKQQILNRELLEEYEEKINLLNKNLQNSTTEYNTKNDEFKNEAKSMKESVLTITSLIFAAFTFIQINFVAFQNTNEYIVWDRLLLFSAVNIFSILGIYCIFSMIRTIILKEDKVCVILKSKLGLISLVFIIIFVLSLNKKNALESDPLYKDRIAYYNKLVKTEKTHAENLKKEIIDLKGTLSAINLDLDKKKKDIIKYTNEINNLKQNFSKFLEDEKNFLVEKLNKHKEILKK